MSMMICDHAKECGNTHCTVGMPHEKMDTCIRGSPCGDVGNKSVHCIPVPATEDESRAEFEKWIVNEWGGDISRWNSNMDATYRFPEVRMAWEAWQEARRTSHD